MLEVNFNPFPNLYTERLELRKHTRNDAASFFFFRSDPLINKHIEREPATSMDEAFAFLDMIDQSLEQNEGVSWAICLEGSTEMIGNIALWRFFKEHHRAEIGYVLHPDHWGKGLMHEAMEAVLKYGFDTLDLHSIEANINPDNNASRNVLVRHGFVQEAHFRENWFFRDKYYDSAIFCKLNPNHA